MAIEDGWTEIALLDEYRTALSDGMMSHLHCGWIISRIVATRAYEVDGTLDRWVRKHLPVAPRTARRQHANWMVVQRLIEASGEPPTADSLSQWDMARPRAATCLPILPSSRALDAMGLLLECEAETVARVWDHAETIAQEAGGTQVEAPHVHKATAEVIAPAPPADPTSEPETNGEPPEPVETEDETRLRRAMAMLPDDCQTTKLIPEVAAALCDREVLNKLARDCQTIRNHLRQIENKECAAYLHTDEARSFLQSASRMIRAAAAWAPCPYCDQKGRKRGNCLVCKPPAPSTRKPLGWVPRLRYKMSPEQLKKAAKGSK